MTTDKYQWGWEWFHVRRLHAHAGDGPPRTVWSATVGPFHVDSWDASLGIWTDEVTPEHGMGSLTCHTLFGLRCLCCGQFTLGCKDHWLCGLCEPCRVKVEDEDWELVTDGVVAD